MFCKPEGKRIEINFPHEGFPRSGEICPQRVKALALGQAEKVDFHEVNVPSVVFSTFLCYPVEKDASRMQFPSASPLVKKQKSKARRLCSFA